MNNNSLSSAWWSVTGFSLCVLGVIQDQKMPFTKVFQKSLSRCLIGVSLDHGVIVPGSASEGPGLHGRFGSVHLCFSLLISLTLHADPQQVIRQHLLGLETLQTCNYAAILFTVRERKITHSV